MTDKEKADFIETQKIMMDLHINMFSRAMEHTKGNIGLSLQLAGNFTSAIVHDQTQNKSFQFLWQLGRDDK